MKKWHSVPKFHFCIFLKDHFSQNIVFWETRNPKSFHTPGKTGLPAEFFISVIFHILHGQIHHLGSLSTAFSSALGYSSLKRPIIFSYDDSVLPCTDPIHIPTGLPGGGKRRPTYPVRRCTVFSHPAS